MIFVHKLYLRCKSWGLANTVAAKLIFNHPMQILKTSKLYKKYSDEYRKPLVFFGLFVRICIEG
jgi:hypothetical protein